MNAVFHVMVGIYAVIAVWFVVLYRLCRDLGYLLIAALCGGCSCLSLWLGSWWPLLIGGILAAVLFFVGSGAWFRGR